MTTNNTNKTEFFFDTADVSAIRKIWDKLKDHCDAQSCLGITTNPNALHKVNCNTLSQFETLVKDMSNVVEEIRGDDGLIYVQVPASDLTPDVIIRWAEYISTLDTGKSKIALKLPHFSYILRLLDNPVFKNLYVNITGISDFGTICRVLNYDNVHYASIIPGRMEEVGIDANAHLAYLSDTKFKPYQKIITGSMRTIKGLESAIYYNTVPTIGTRVWDLFESTDAWKDFPNYWVNTYRGETDQTKDFSPITSEVNVELSRSFFKQMDELGQPLRNDFLKN